MRGSCLLYLISGCCVLGVLICVTCGLWFGRFAFWSEGCREPLLSVKFRLCLVLVLWGGEYEGGGCVVPWFRCCDVGRWG